MAEQVERMRFRTAPLLATAAWFAAGIVLSHWRSPPVLLMVLCSGLLAVVTVTAMVWAPRAGWLPVAAIWILTGAIAGRFQPEMPSTGAIHGYADGLSRRVMGQVTRVKLLTPEPAAVSDSDSVASWEAAEEVEASGEQAVSVDLALEQIEQVTPDVATMVPVEGGLRLSVYAAAGTPLQFACGDVLEATVRLKVPERYRDPGVWQYADYLLSQGIVARASTNDGKVRVLGTERASWHCRAVAIQSWAVGRLAGYTGSKANHVLPRFMRWNAVDAGMLDAMLFGDRAGLSRQMRLGFERTGSFHLFVVSGLHVALLAGGMFWLLRRLRFPAWLATIATVTAAGGYAVLTGFGQPVQRALAMTAMFLVGKLFLRHGNSLNALGAAALGMMVYAPGCIFEASFQMTVLAIVAIAGIAAPLANRSFAGYTVATRNVFGAGVRGHLPPKVAQLRVMLQLYGEAFADALGGWTRHLPATGIRWALLAVELACIGIVAELVMVLPMAMYFHRMTVFAVPANLIVVPVLAILAPAAVATFAASLVSPWLAVVPGALTASLLHGVSWLIARFSHLTAADVRTPGPAWWVAVLAGSAWVVCCWAVRRERWGAWVTLALLPATALLVLWPARPVVVPNRLEVTAIDVGQGDSLLVAGPDGRLMLVDAGGPVGARGASEVTSRYDVGEEVVSPYLWTRHVRRLDVVVLTHAHTDHMGGMSAVLRNFHPSELWVGIDPDSAIYRRLLVEAGGLGIPVRHLHAGQTFVWGQVGVRVLAPALEYVNAGSPKNDDSVVLRLGYGLGSVLLEGDAERRSEEGMLAAGELTPVTLLKVGHHGSMTSTSAGFLAALAPRDAVISVGKQNTFGHPRGEVIGRLADRGTRVYRTDEFGLTSFLIGSDGGIEEIVGTR